MTNRLRIGFDLDGVVYDFVTAFAAWLRRSAGRGAASLPLPHQVDDFGWDFYERHWGLSTTEFHRHFADGVNAGFVFAHGAPYDGAVAAMRRIVDAGHEIHVVTARRVPGAEAAAERSTHAWLARWAVPHHSVTFNEDKACLPLDAFIDDAPHNYDSVERAAGRPWLLTRPWNARHPGRRVATLDEFADVVDDLAARRAPLADRS